METKIPARCSKCQKLGYITDLVQMDGPASRAANFAAAGRVAGAMFINCSFVSTCECGGELESLEGDYVMNGEEATLLRGPETSWEALKELAAVVAASVEAGETAEQTFNRAAKLLPFLGKYKQLAAGLAIPSLIWLVQQVAAIKLGQEMTPTPITHEQTSALILQSEQRLMDAIEGMKRKNDAVSALQPHLGLSPRGNPLFDEYPLTARRLAEHKNQH